MSFTVYKSSAGSGKTYTLVKSYLKIVLQGKEPNRYRNILAITFTNKAAAEMKSRVIDALTALSSANEPSGTAYYLLQDLVKELDLPEQEIRLKCGAVLTSMLHNYSDIAISTIDKFVHKIVRNFAFDLQIPLNFSVEMDTENMLRTAIDLLISKVGSDEKLTQALVAFTESKAEDNKSWKIEEDLRNFSFDLLKEQNSLYLNKLKQLSLSDFFEIKDKLQRFVVEFEQELSKIGSDALATLERNGVEHKDLAGGATKGIAKYFGYLKFNADKSYEPTPTVQKMISEDKWNSTKANNEAISRIESIKHELKNYYDRAQEVLQHGLSNHILFSGIYRNIYSLSLLNEIEKVIEEIKRENNQIHISDFNKKIAGIVMNEPVPFIYERIGEKFKNYLIDEFQDTSLLQWQNFVPLIENSLATNEYNMLVGDGKQAIYRWRGGEVEQFTRLPHLFKAENNPLIEARESSLVRNFEEAFLKHNRRSKRELIEFNNSFFKYSAEQATFPEELRNIYSAVEQEFEPGNSGGYVNFHFVDSKEEEYEAHEAIGKQVVLTLKELLDSGYQLSDIAILTRKNKNGVALSNYLLNEGIAVVSKESLLLATAASVNFILSLLSFLNNAQDSIARSGIMEYLLQRKGSEGIQSLNTYFEGEDFFRDYIQKHYPHWNRARLLEFPLYELCEELTRVFELNTKADPYVVFFLDAVYAYAQKNNNSIPDFLVWWEKKKENLSILIPNGLNAVQVMTIHKSKGLEFPVVIFPYANWSNQAMHQKMWVNLEHPSLPNLKSALLPFADNLEKTSFEKEYTEEKNKKFLDDFNVLYVAFTRAVNRLYVISELPAGTKKIANFYVDYLRYKELWQDGTMNYSFGVLQNKPEGNKAKDTILMEELTSIVSEDWRYKISLSNGSEKLWDSETTRTEKDYGNLMHTALSRIFCVEDIETSVNSMLLEGLLISGEVEMLTKKLKKLLSQPDIAPFFEKGLEIKTEAELLLPEGKSYRPDRVVFYAEKAVVLDYKTGIELEKHKNQINAYAETIGRMGFSRVEKYLLYTATEKLLIV